MFQEIVSETTQRGTVRWASPERLDSDDPPTPSSDVWSWGWLTREVRLLYSLEGPSSAWANLYVVDYDRESPVRSSHRCLCRDI